MEDEDCSPTVVEHPLYWVNVLRGRVEAEQLHRLHRLLLLRSPSSEEWIAEFIKARGLAGLFDVHENLFWRLYYTDSKGRGARVREDRASDDKETFLACTNCLLPIFSSRAGINAVTKGNRSEVQEQVEQLMLSLASRDQEAREKVLWVVITIVGVTPTDARARARLSEMAHTLWDGLGSLQILLEEKNIYAPLVNVIREARGPRALALVGHVLTLITLALDGLHPDIVSYEHIYSRNKLRNGFFSAGLTLAMDKQALQSQASSDSDALAIYTTAVKKWDYCKARDEKYSEALTIRTAKCAIPSGELNTKVPNLDAYSYCEPTLEPETKQRTAPRPLSLAPSSQPAKSASKQFQRQSPSSPSSKPRSSPAASPKQNRSAPKKPAASHRQDSITIEERKKRRGIIEDDDDEEVNNYKVDFGVGTNYVMCADDFIEAETDRLQHSSDERAHQADDLGGGGSGALSARKQAARQEDDIYALATFGDDENDNDDGNDDEEETPEESVSEESTADCCTSTSCLGSGRTWTDSRGAVASSGNLSSRASLRSFTLGGYRGEGRRTEGPTVDQGDKRAVGGWTRSQHKGVGVDGGGSGENAQGRRRRGAMSFVGLRQLQERDDQAQQDGLKPKPLPSTIASHGDAASIDPYLDFLVSVTTARLANSGSSSPSSAASLSKSSSSPSSSSLYTLASPSSSPLQSSMPASALQGPLYSVMRRQQLEVQQARKRLDAEVQASSIASSTSATSNSSFRIGNTQTTPQDLRSLASIVKRGYLCAWSVQQGKDHKTGLPVPVSVFDPVRVIIDEINLYIAPQTAAETLWPTMIALSSIHRVREFRTASKDWIDKHGLTIEFMTDTASRSEKVTLVAPNKKSQQWWMKAVIMNKGNPAHPQLLYSWPV